MPRRRKTGYDPIPFQELLRQQLDESEESYRGASVAAGLNRSAISSYLKGARPMRDACIALSDHFGINPNRMLVAAGYEPLELFDRRAIDLSEVTPEGKRILEKLDQITDPKIRRQLFRVIDVMLDGYLLAEEGTLPQTETPESAPQPVEGT